MKAHLLLLLLVAAGLIGLLRCTAAAEQVVDDEDGEYFYEEEEDDGDAAAPVINNNNQAPTSDDSFDEEEFEGFEQLAARTPSPAASSSSSSSSSSATPAAANGRAGDSLAAANKTTGEPKSYVIELVFVVAMLAYAINFLLGRRHNEALARSWLLTFQPLFHGQFAHLGQLTSAELEAYRSGQHEQDRRKPILFEKQSQSEFRFTATGRRHCTGMQATLQTIKRHDLASVVYGLLVPVQDRLLIEIPLLDDSHAAFVFVLAKAGMMKTLAGQYKEIAHSSRPVGTLNKLLPGGGFVAQTDAPEAAAALLADAVVAQALKEAADAQDLHFVMITDQNTCNAGVPRLLRLGCRLPAAADMPRIQRLLAAVFVLLDLACQAPLKTADRTFQTKLRSVAAKVQSKVDAEQRKEQMEKQAAEKREAERRRYEAMSPAEQERYDQKKQRREMKKRQGKAKMVVIG